MKNITVVLGAAAVALGVALAGCQTTTAGTSGNSIQTEQTGLAPNGDAQHATIDFSVFLGNRNSVTSWKIEMVTGVSTEREWSGDAKSLPTTLTWDGRSAAGSAAPEGTYTAVLTTDNGTGSPSMARSQNFILDISAPTGSLTFVPEQFTAARDGAVEPVNISITGRSVVARMDSWSLDIIDEAGRAFHSFDGKWPGTEIRWDGKSSRGDPVAPSHSYYAQVTLRDQFGRTATITSGIAVSGLPDAAPAAQQGRVSISPATAGFSPNGDNVMDAITLALSYGDTEKVSSWKVEILDSDKRDQKTFSGDGSKPPAVIRWDGKKDAGTAAQEGIYTARISVEYRSAATPAAAVSSPFALDITPPAGSVTLSEPLFSPMEASPTITLNVDASSKLARIDSWEMEIYDPENHLFQTFHSQWPARTAVWDGKGFKGDLVLSAEDYRVVVRVRDEFGNVGDLKSMIPVDILVEDTPTGYRILSSRIFFKPYTADYTDVKPELADQNVRRLADMAAKLRKFPNYRIRLVGHAVMIHWDSRTLGDIEQRDVLLPLSAARADAVKAAMVDQGLDASLFTAQGVGAADPLVPDSDLADHWQNRRVAFFIEK